MSNTKDYNLSAKQAAEKLDKSVTTIHRYISKGKLNATYVNTDHGREVRVRESEVEKLSEKQSKLDSLQTGRDVFNHEKQNTKRPIDLKQLLERYEKSLYQLGQLTERLENQKEKRENKINRLEKEEQRLKSHLHDKAALIEALQNELNRPLSVTERLRGQRFTNH